MNKVVVAAALGLLAAGSALASDKADIMAVLQLWISGEAGTVAACADDAAVVDDLPPFEWHGPGACARWRKDSDAYNHSEGVTAAVGTIGNPQQLVVSADRAYVVLPTTFAFNQKGKPVKETATSTLVLRKTPGGWRIVAWTWATQTIQ